MTTPIKLDARLLDRCARDTDGPVAIHLVEHLVPVEGEGQPFFPPTYASRDQPYNVDTLADGTKVALVDSVGAQANRMEPIFLTEPFRKLVPQVDITYGSKKDGTAGRVSLLEVGHRLGDAVIRCTEMADEARGAFIELLNGDAGPLAKLAPTSLVFGAWDSRDTGVKIPRVVQSVVRAWDVSILSRSAQFFPALDYASLGVISEKASENERSPEAKRGFAAVPSTGDPGGVVARGPIRRDVTINLVALRRLGGESVDALRAYILGLALVAAGEAQDPFLRQGCLLVPDSDSPPVWSLVERSGARVSIDWSEAVVREYAEAAASSFGVGPDRELEFDKKRAADDKNKKAK